MIDNKTRYINDRLNYIRNRINSTVKGMNYEKCYEIDIKIKKQLEKIYDGKQKNEKKDLLFYQNVNSKEEKELEFLILYYYALYNDNLTFFKKLIKEKYNFHSNLYNLNLFILDKRLISALSEDELIKILKEYPQELKMFYMRLTYAKKTSIINKKELLQEYNELEKQLLFSKYLSTDDLKVINNKLSKISSMLNNKLDYKYNEEEIKKYLRDFAYIVNHNPNIFHTHDNESQNLTSLVTPKSIDVFGCDGLINLNDNQKIMIDRNYYHQSNNCYNRLKEIFTKYPNYHSNLIFSDELLNNFTNEEIVNLNPDLEKLFRKADENGSISKVKILLDNGFDYNLLDEALLRTLKVDELFNLFDKSKNKIRKLLQYKRRLSKLSDERETINSKIKKIAIKDINKQDIVRKVR